MKFVKKPIVIEAVQWHKNGDHPLDFEGIRPTYPLNEGKVVRYFRSPTIPGTNGCRHCDKMMHDHGWIDTLEGGHIVCPSDYIITGIKGEMYPCKKDIFHATYDPLPTDIKNT